MTIHAEHTGIARRDFWLRLRYELRRISHYGPAALLTKAGLRFVSFVTGLVLLPLTCIFHILGFRRVTVFTDRIGHLAMEPDCLLKEQALGHVPRRRWFILAPPQRVANRHMLRYWRPFIRVFEDPAACFILQAMTRWGLMRYDISHYILAANRAQAAYHIYSEWGDRPPLLSMTPSDEEWGAEVLTRLGLPSDAWFACVHVREPGFSPVDEELHTHRNADVENVIPAIREIANRGGWVIRMGDPSMTVLPSMPHVIDYAHHPMKSERLDIILCARARFMLGNTSGIALVSTVFGVPCAIANSIPVSTLWFSGRDISIPKLLWSEHLGRHLTFEEIMNSPIANYRYAALYRQNGISVMENSADDIQELVVEMLDHLDGTSRQNSDDIHLVRTFHALLQKHHFSFGSMGNPGVRFLRRHRELLPPADSPAPGHPLGR